MNRKGHLITAVVFSVAFYLILSNLNIKDFFWYSLPLYPATLLPDLIEPAINFSHRRFFHSRRVFLILSIALGISIFLALKNPRYYFLSSGIAGYLLHLIGDMISWRGLPR